jgi:hypothetical protein
MEVNFTYHLGTENQRWRGRDKTKEELSQQELKWYPQLAHWRMEPCRGSDFRDIRFLDMREIGMSAKGSSSVT